jgi:hypothetical protein
LGSEEESQPEDEIFGFVGAETNVLLGAVHKVEALT